MIRLRLHIVTLLALFVTISSVHAGDGLRYVFLPNEVLVNAFKPDEKVYLAGFVSDIKEEENGIGVELNVTDGHAHIVVRYDGIFPAMITTGNPAVFNGTLQSGVFVATEILLMSPEGCEKYLPPVVREQVVSLGFYECSPAGS